MFLRLGHVHAHVTPPHSSLLEKVLVPSTQDSQNSKNSFIYMLYCVNKSLLIVCEPTSKSCPRDPRSRPVTAPKTHFSFDPNQISSISSIFVFLAQSFGNSFAQYRQLRFVRFSLVQYCKLLMQVSSFLYSCFQV